jgi:FAD-dependent urate hydroxylase
MQISIIGAGIGGLTTALALDACGHEVSVYERGEKPASQGAGYVLWPNAMYVLEHLGLAKEVRAIGGELRSMDRLSKHAERLTSLDLNYLQQLMGFGSYAVLRKDFLDLLVRAVLKKGIALHFNHTLSHFIPERTKLTAVFQHGHSCTSDFVIGADGRMNSIARRVVTGENAPSYQGFVNWVGFLEHDHFDFTLGTVLDYWGLGERFGIVPVSPGKSYWAAGAVFPLKQAPDDKIGLLERFADWPTEINQIIDATKSNHINAIFVHDLEPKKPWYKDRVLMLGDAAHACLPTSGQGACQAIEDAFHITECLMNFSGRDNRELSQRLQRFQQIRFDKTASIARSARHFAKQIFSTNPEICFQRDQIARAGDARSIVSGMAELWNWGLQ